MENGNSKTNFKMSQTIIIKIVHARICVIGWSSTRKKMQTSIPILIKKNKNKSLISNIRI